MTQEDDAAVEAVARALREGGWFDMSDGYIAAAISAYRAHLEVERQERVAAFRQILATGGVVPEGWDDD